MVIFRNKRALVILILAVVVGFLVRAWKINTFPFPPSGDELAFGYYGWSLLTTGGDEYGNKLPLYFPSIGDYKYPTLAYLNTLPALLFGLSDITVRFWSLMAGVGLIVLVAVIGELVLGSVGAGLAAAWMVALNPWSTIMSRASYESNVAVTLAALWLVAFWKKKWKLSLAFFILAIYCYSATRIFFGALLTLLLVFSLINKEWTKWRKILAVYLAVTTVITALSFIPWESRARAQGVVATELNAKEVDRLEQLYVGAGISPIKLPPRVTWFFHNKWRVIGFNFLKEYISYYTPGYMFFYGGPNNEALPDVGVLLLAQLLFLPLGLLTLNKSKGMGAGVVIAWVLAAPAASALTTNGPNMIRSAMMIPPLALISGWGLYQIFSFNRSRLYLTVASGAVILSVTWSGLFFLNQLLVQKPVEAPWKSHQGTKEMVLDVWKARKDYKAVAIGEDNYIAFLYYNKISSKEFLATAKIRPEARENQWDRVDSLDNIKFKMPYECPMSGKANVLYVCRGLQIPQNAKIIKVYRFLDGLPHYTTLTFVPYAQVDKEGRDELPSRLDYMVDRDGRFTSGIIPDSETELW